MKNTLVLSMKFWVKLQLDDTSLIFGVVSVLGIGLSAMICLVIYMVAIGDTRFLNLTALICLAAPYPFDPPPPPPPGGGSGLVNLVSWTCAAGMRPSDKNAITIVYAQQKQFYRGDCNQY